MKADVIVRLPFLTCQFHKADKHSDRKQYLEQFDCSKLKTKGDIKTNLRLVKKFKTKKLVVLPKI